MILFAWHLMLISNLLIRNCYNRYGCNPSVEDSGGVEWSCSEQLSPLCPAAARLIRAISRHAVYHWIIKPISQLWGSWILTLILSGKSAFAFKTANSLPKRPSTFTNLINLLHITFGWLAKIFIDALSYNLKKVEKKPPACNMSLILWILLSKLNNPVSAGLVR